MKEETKQNKWGNLTKEQIEEIINGAGEKKIVWWDWYSPFRHTDTLVYGGFCGLCGKWNWNWCGKGLMLTTPSCKECGIKYEDPSLIN